MRAKPRNVGRTILGGLIGLLWKKDGNVGPLMALLIVPIAGAFALAIETGDWYVTQRAMQNAADAAAIAAAVNGTTNEATKCATVSGDFCFEGRGAAAKYGFTDGANSTTVTVSYADVSAGGACPGGAAACYTATITRKLPIYLTKLVGFNGDTTIGSAPAQTILARAVVSRGKPVNYCMMALGNGTGTGNGGNGNGNGNNGSAFTLNGAQSADLTGCDLFSNGGLNCNGNLLLTAPYGDAVGTPNSCGANHNTVTHQVDPFSSLDANPPIPAGSCSGGTPQGTLGPTLSTSSATWNGQVLCGDVRLNNDVCITDPNTVLTIYNGHLDLAGHALRTSSANPACTTPPNTPAGSLTIIFTGPPTGNTGGTTYNHIPVNSTGTGVIDIAAPASGTLKGVAIMQDSRQNGNRDNNDITYHGNDPTLNIQGLLYLPNSNVNIAGAINLHDSGLSCIGIIANTIVISGSGSIFKNDAVGVTTGCPQAGLTLPTVAGTTSRNALALVR